MSTIIAEYIWLGGNGELRSKTKIFNSDTYYRDALQGQEPLPPLNIFSEWNYDGSSTSQASGHESEIKIKPRACYHNPLLKNTSAEVKGFLVLCDTYDKDYKPLPTNSRYKAAKTFSSKSALENKPWFGLEQEYFLFPLSNNTPTRYRSPEGVVRPQGEFYCSVGANKAYERFVVEEHMFACIKAGLKICGVNAEVAPGQWEYQIGPCEGIEAGDQMWISRWLMERITEKYNIEVCWHPKPLEHFNGSGCHTNFSTKNMREGTSDKHGMLYIFDSIKRLAANHTEHMEIYGEGNKMRMSGEYETSDYNNFAFDINKPVDRGASIRIGYDTIKNKCGYFEDRRPASNVDPYVVTEKIFSSTFPQEISVVEKV